MKHFKEGINHIFEFGEISITRIKLKPSQYDELADYFAQQEVKNLNIPDVIKSVCGCGKIGEYSKKLDKVLCDECFDELLSQTVL